MHANIITFITCSLVYGSYSKPAEERIVGGQATTVRDFPYQLSLEVDGKPNCSASIISANWALTAAVCVNSGKTKPEQVAFRAGSDDKNKGGTIHHATKILISSDFNATTFEYDATLIQVREPFPIGTPGVNRVLLTWDEPIDGRMANVSGWGIVNNKTNQQTDKLNYVEVPIVNRGVCYGTLFGIWQVTQRMICAGYAEGGKDPCTGDYGAPLVINGTQVGIVSKTFCGQPNHPAVYSDIAPQRFWIRSNANV